MSGTRVPLEAFVPWRTSERPPDWACRFARSAPLEVEIGFGNGDWLVGCAESRAGHDFVGIENQWPSVRRALRKIRTRGVTNVRLLMADARVALARLITPRTLHTITALFPCPWPKTRHAKHRLFDADFLALMNSRLEDGRSALIVTDHQLLLEWMLEQVPSSGFSAHAERVTPRYRTKYERKWEQQGQAEFHELHLLKESHRALPLLEDHPVQAHRLSSFDPQRFHPSRIDQEDLHVEVKELLFDAARRKAMVQVVVAEGPLGQNFWIEVVWRQDHWRIQPARGCGLVPTPGVQRALDLVREAAG